MGQAAYNTILKSSGTPVVFNSTPTTLVGNKATITDAARQILDIDTPVIVYSDDALVPESDFTVDLLFGEITLVNGYEDTEIRVGGAFVPVTEVAGASSYSLNYSANVIDVSNFKDAKANGGYRVKTTGLIDAGIEIARFSYGERAFKDSLVARKKVMVELQIGGGAETIRGWFVQETASSEGDIDSVETESLSFQLAGNELTSISWKVN